MKEVIINSNDAGQRLDKFLVKYFGGSVPNSFIYKNIRKKRIKLNGKRAENDTFLNEGDVLNLYINDSVFDEIPEFKTVSNLPLPPVVYEDDNIIILNKPQGVSVHDDGKGAENTLVNSLLAYLIDKGEYIPQKEQSFIPAFCNRIDRNTEGLVVAAKNAESLREMNRIIKERLVEKKYLAICEGKIKEEKFTLSGYIVKNTKTKRSEFSDKKEENAKRAVSEFKVVSYMGNMTLVEVNLITGRTHQIRAQLGSIGHPLRADRKYGGKGEGLYSLSAYKLTFSNDLGVSPLYYLASKIFTIEPSFKNK